MDHTTHTTHTFASLDTHNVSLLLLPVLTHVVHAWAPSWGTQRHGSTAEHGAPSGRRDFFHPPTISLAISTAHGPLVPQSGCACLSDTAGHMGVISLLPQTTYAHRAHMHNARVSILLACVSQRTLSERVRLRGRLSNRTSFRRLRPSGTEAYVSE